MIDYIFYRFSKLKVYQPIYWAKIFTPLTFVVTIFPIVLTLSRFFFGCYDQNELDGMIKLILLVPSLAIMLLSDFYYSEEKVKRIQAKYSGESKSETIIKLILIGIIFFTVFWFGSFVVKVFVNVPACK